MRTLLLMAAVVVCFSVFGCGTSDTAGESGVGNSQVAASNFDPVKSFQSILYSERELASRSFQPKEIDDMTYTYVPNSLKFDVKETDSLVNKYQADLEFKVTETDALDPSTWKIRFLYDGSDWRATEWTMLGHVKGGGNFRKFVYDDYGKGCLGVAVKNVK